MTTRWLRDNMALIESEGATVISTASSGSGHYKLVVRTPLGDKALFISRTPSDGRAMKNNRSIIRRWMKGTP